LDTNVIVSSVISQRGAPREVLLAWQAGSFELVTSPALIAEVARALRYRRIMERYSLSETDVRAVVTLLWTQGRVIEDPERVEPLTGDPADDLVLAVSRDGQAEFPVTGDRILLDLGEHWNARVVTPRTFVEALT